MVAAFDYCLHGRGGAAPSIDTAMHGLVDADHVDHLHPDSGIALRDGRRRRGADAALLRRPGRVGAVAAPGLPARPRHRRDPARPARGDRRDPRRPRHHRLGRDLRRVRGATRSRSSGPAERVHRRARPAGPVRRGRSPATSRSRTRERRARAAALLPLLRGLASTDRPQVGHFTDTRRRARLPRARRASAPRGARARRARTTSCGPRSGRWSSTCRRRAPIEAAIERLRGAARGVPRGLRAPTTSATRRPTARRCAAPTRRSCSSRASGCSASARTSRPRGSPASSTSTRST